MLTNSTKRQIYGLFEDCVMRTIERLQQQDTHRPFHTSLLTDEVVFWSRFERSFSTSFGQSVIEKISRLVCLGAGASVAHTQHDEAVTLTTVQWEAIEAIVRSSRDNTGYIPNWAEDLEKARAGRVFGSPDTRRVRTDLYWVREGVPNYMSIKTVKPNLDQTAEAKRDLLRLAAQDGERNVYFGLYYNPFGTKREDYAFSPPMRIFNFATDEPILLGQDYWNTLGGTGTYEEVLEISRMVGIETKKKIQAYGLVDIQWINDTDVR